MAERISVSGALDRLEHSELGCKRKFVPNIKKALNKKTIEDDRSNKVPRKEGLRIDTNNTNSRSNSARDRSKPQQRDGSQYVQSYSIFETGIGCATKSDRNSVEIQDLRQSSSSVSRTKVKEVAETETKEDPLEQCDAFIADIKQVFRDPPVIMKDSAASSGAPLDPLKKMDLSSGRNHRVPFEFFSNAGPGRLFTLQLPDKVIPSNLDDLKDGKFGKIQVLDNQKVRLLVGGTAFELLCPHKLTMASDVVLADQQTEETVRLNCMGHIEQAMLAAPSLDEFVSLGR